MTSLSLVRLAILVATLAAFGAPVDAQQASTSDVSLDSLLNTHISAASKYAQISSAAPGSVTIVSSDDIKSYGYRNLQEVLENVRGFYVSNDRNFSYLGTRGFSRTSDYNSRVLMLIDGHSINDQLLGSTPVGTDLPINLDAVERIEIVQGPGSALYGTGAMFAVINIVTKTALALDGGIVRVGVGSVGERVTGVAGGHTFGSRLSVTGSALLTNVKGGDQYYREFDTPATQNGVARGLDWEHGVSGYGTLKWSELTVQTGYRTRSKGIPTAPFGMVFGDSRAQAVDKTFWGDVALQHEWSGSVTFTGRVYTDYTNYNSVYPFDPSPSTYDIATGSTSAGTEMMLGWEPSSRLRLTAGTDDRFVTRATYSEHIGDLPASSDDAPFHVLSGFAQSELQLWPSAMLVTGVRVDRYSTVGSATTPRLGLILTPTTRTTIKLLYGEAFRAPSAGQASLTAGAFEENPNLKPERIATTEINMQQRLGSALLFDVSAYRYVLHDLIDQSFVGYKIVYQNLSSAEATGLEFQLDARPVGPLSAHVSYVLQEAKDAQEKTLTNSPQQVANIGVTAHAGESLRAAVQLRYESGRRTLASETSPFLRTDTNFGFQPGGLGSLSWLRNTELGLRVTNVFDVAYATPAGAGNRQDTIAADGRTYALRMEWQF
jgi:outer membrane receptor protein involved in Fe transport